MMLYKDTNPESCRVNYSRMDCYCAICYFWIATCRLSRYEAVPEDERILNAVGLFDMLNEITLILGFCSMGLKSRILVCSIIHFYYDAVKYLYER